MIGVLRETWPGEARVGATPSTVRSLVVAGHPVIVEQSAGVASGYADDDYIRAGAEIAPTAEETIDRAAVLWKVLRPSAHEVSLLRSRAQGVDRPAHAVLALMHAGPELPEGVTVYAAERLRDGSGARPVLAAMSEIAGPLAVGMAAAALGRASGGRGLLLGGVAGVPPAEVVVIGAGVAGRGAAGLAAAMGASVTLLDVDLARLRAVVGPGGIPGLRTMLATPHAVERVLAYADVVIAAVHDGSGVAPRVAGRAHLALMQPGAVVVDLSVTDGGAFASTPTTTLDAPGRVVDGVVHVGVPNLAGNVPRTASQAYAQAALPFVHEAAQAAQA